MKYDHFYPSTHFCVDSLSTHTGLSNNTGPARKKRALNVSVSSLTKSPKPSPVKANKDSNLPTPKGTQSKKNSTPEKSDKDQEVGGTCIDKSCHKYSQTFNLFHVTKPYIISIIKIKDNRTYLHVKKTNDLSPSVEILILPR